MMLNSADDVLHDFGRLVNHAAHTFESDADITLTYDDLAQEGYCSLFYAFNIYGPVCTYFYLELTITLIA